MEIAKNLQITLREDNFLTTLSVLSRNLVYISLLLRSIMHLTKLFDFLHDILIYLL
jgi:hypothetical protein